MLSSAPNPSHSLYTQEEKEEENDRSSPDSEYSTFAKDLMRGIDSLQAEHQELAKQVTSIINEYKRMKDQLLLTMEDNIQQLSQLIADESEEKAMIESVLEMWHIATQEIDYLENLLAEKTSGREFEERIEEVKAEYAKALESLSEELAAARIELRNLKNDLKNKNNLLDENKKVIENVSLELARKERQIKDASLKERELSSKIMNLETSLAECKKVLSEKDEEISSLNKESDELHSLNEKLKNEATEWKAQKLAAQKDAKENLLTTEKAVLEKEEAVYKEQQALQEIQHLKDSINQVVEQTTSRYKSEIQNTRKQFHDKQEAMMNEIQALELENNEKQSMYERVVREKEAIESELQSLYEKNTSGTPVSNSIFDDICKKLVKAERSKKEVELEAAALQTSLKDMKLSHEQEKHFLQEECRRLKTRLQHMQADLSGILLSRTQLSDEAELLKKKNYKTEKVLANAKSGHRNDIYLLEQKLQKKEHAFHHQLHMAEERHKRAIDELQHLLDAQYGINNKWKDEVQELTKKFESKIKELYEDNVRLHQQNEEFSRTLQQKQVGTLMQANYSPPYEVGANQMDAIYVNR